MNIYYATIGIENYRIFSNYTEFEFRPITILTGPNNSGKSSLIKFLLLIKDNLDYFQSVRNKGNKIEKRISFMGNTHKLNNFDSIVANNKKPLIFKIHLLKDIYYRYVLNNNGRVEHTINLCDKDDNEILTLAGNELKINLQLFIEFFASNPTISSLDTFEDTIAYSEYVFENYRKIENYAKNSQNNIVNFDLTKIPDSNPSLKKLKRQSNEFLGVKILETAFEYFLDFDIDTISEFNVILHFDDSYLRFFTNIFYLPSIKGLQKRVYQYSDEDSLNRIIRAINEKGFWNKTAEKFLNKWINEFGLGKKVSFGHDQRLGVNYVFIDDKSLIDLGFGFTQILSILLQSCEILVGLRYTGFNTVLILEEPETNLHPKFQSKLAELVVDLYDKYKISFLIETHSEYLIRKLQYLTAKKEIKPDESIIYYFHHPSHIPQGEKQVKELHIREDGMMDGDFGPGFFDESTQLTLDLLKLQKN